MTDDNGHDRLKALSDKIADIRADEQAEAVRDTDAKTNSDNMSVGARAGAELVTCFMAGALIGWFLDKQFDTSPIFLIIFLLTGICTGFYGVYRITNNLGSAVGFAAAKKKSRKP